MNEHVILNRSFGAVGKEHGYDSISAEFTEFKEFKVKWRRSCGWAEFEVSDYLKDAPREVMEGVACVIFTKISGKDGKECPDEMHRWITSEDFVKKKQPIYLERSRNIAGTASGEYTDLNEAYQRLIDLGLVDRNENLKITWTKRPNVKRVGYCSVLMKVIMISSVFDTPSIPQFVTDYVLYHELIHMERGFDPFEQRHSMDFSAQENLYPMCEEAKAWLKKLRLYL
jgi:hypothetical protein